jgi:hypothetical protein
MGMTNKGAAFLPIGIGVGVSIGVALGSAIGSGLGVALMGAVNAKAKPAKKGDGSDGGGAVIPPSDTHHQGGHDGGSDGGSDGGGDGGGGGGD